MAGPSSATVNNEITLGDTNITKFRVPGINVFLKDNGGTPTEGHVLTVDSNGEAGFAAVGGGFPSGTKMLFQQTSAPTGWTKVTSGVDNKALRVVSGTAGSGGSNAFSNTLADRSITANSANTTAGGNISVASATTGGTVDNHTLSINEIPSHNHELNDTGVWYNAGQGSGGPHPMSRYSNVTTSQTVNTQSRGGGGAHSHGFTGGSHNHNATFSGSAHNHSITVTNLDMAVQYLDVIIAQKD